MSRSERKVTVSVVQAGSVLLDTPQTLEKLAELAAAARKAGAQLVVFPEAFIGGYPKGQDFGITLGRRSAAGRDDFQKYFENAIEIPGPETEFLANVARENELYLVTGVIERSGGTLYCTVVFHSSSGQYLGKHRKLMPTALERCIWGCGDGSTLTVVETPYGKVGAVICWENYMPLLRTAMYSKGIEIYCAPTVDDRETWVSTMRHVACEGRCFVLSACQYLVEETPSEPAHDSIAQKTGSDPLPLCLEPKASQCGQGSDPLFCAMPTSSEKTESHPVVTPIPESAPLSTFYSHLSSRFGSPLIRGGSCIVSPLGELLAGPVYGSEQILTAEIDLNEIARGKFDLDVIGHYSRPDIFQLHVNEQEQRAVRPADSVDQKS